jgi:uncharacterized protein YdiU (UPF0061 family)
VDDESIALISDLLSLMEENRVDYTRTLRALCDFRATDPDANAALCAPFADGAAFDQWAARYSKRLRDEHSDDASRTAAMKQHNPKYILRNYLAQTAIEKATMEKDFTEIDRLLALLRDPFSEQPEFEAYAAEPPEWAEQIAVSCSS